MKDCRELLTSVWFYQFSRILVIVLVTNIWAIAAPSDRLERKELRPSKEGMPGEESIHREVDFGKKVKLKASIEVTAKGNGALRLGNLNLKVFDSHDDGVVYENELLTIDIADLDGDGARELIVSGIVVFTEDERPYKVIKREHVVFIYKLRNRSNFDEVYRNTNFRIDLR